MNRYLTATLIGAASMLLVTPHKASTSLGEFVARAVIGAVVALALYGSWRAVRWCFGKATGPRTDQWSAAELAALKARGSQPLVINRIRTKP